MLSDSVFVAADQTRRHPPEGRTADSPLYEPRWNALTAGEIPPAVTDDRLWNLDDFGRLSQIADFDDNPELAESFEPGPVEFINRAQGSLFALIENRTGETMSEEEFADAVASAQILNQQQDRLAYKLAQRGIRTDETTQSKLWLVCPITGHAIEQRQFRRVNIFPLVAQSRRSKLLIEAEKFMEGKKRVPYSRFITVTNGPRIPLTLANWPLFRSRIQQLQNRAGTFNRQPWAKRYGLELVLRATEFGSLRRKDGTPWRDPETGAMLMHPHLHCLLIFTKGPVPRDVWKKMLSKTGDISRHFGAMWDAGETIRNLRECIKYPLKPNDLDLLSEDETLAFFKANFRLRMVEPLGRFREYRRELRLNLRKIVRWRGKDGKMQLKLVRDWNKHPIKSEPGHADALRRQRLADDHTGPTMNELCGFSPLDGQAERYRKVRAREVAQMPERKTVENMIVARMAPMPAFDRVIRPAVLVLGYTGNFEAIRDHRAVAPMREAAVRALSARDINVHTTHFIRRPSVIPPGRGELIRPSGGSGFAQKLLPITPRHESEQGKCNE